MNGFRSIMFTVLLAAIAVAARCGERANCIVAADGSGRFTSIQTAIDSARPTTGHPWVILIRNGIYHEKLMISKGNIAIVGETRDSTRIVYPELRKVWRAAHDDSDWGSAVINVGNHVQDLVIANLTVGNTYGSEHPGEHDHQFTIRGGGSCTRISLLNCTVTSDGGDTYSLWNPGSGMYYCSGCSFSGWVDFVCPRGWCYITDSRFFGHEPVASIWHDGSADSTSRFVIRNSSFDGITGFALGRNHRDGQFFLYDCTFSERMADRPIYQAKDSASYRWGKRYYYNNCHRTGGDFSWFSDNFTPGATVSAAGTFDGRWDPEATMPPVLPGASLPRPADRSHGIPVALTNTVEWTGGRNAESYNVYFGTAAEPPFITNQSGTSYIPDHLNRGTTYYWRIDAVSGSGAVRGMTWSFSTGS